MSTTTKTDVYQEVTDAIVAQLEKGVAPWRKPWVSISGEMPSNLKSRKPYRGVNQLLLSMMPFTSPWWVTFKQAREAGGCVRKGERSTIVVFWKRLKVEDATSATGYKVIPMLRHYRVFNVEQCEGVKVPEASELPDFDPVSEADVIVNGYGYPRGPKVSHGGDVACWIPLFDEIRMPLREAFKTPAAYYSTMFHEFTHSTGNEARLNRPEITETKIKFGSVPYGKEELTAEMGAAMLCAHAGLFTETAEPSAAYIASWLRTIKGDPKLVIGAAGKAQRAVDYILGTTFEEESSADAHQVVTA